MAWGVKYQVNAHDIHDIAWTLKLYEDDYTGAITYFTAATEEPVVIDDCNESDDPVDPIRDKRAYVYVFCNSMFALADICALEEMAFWAELYQGANLYMSGWVDPSEYEESYGPVPYIAKIGIVDGLAVLPKIKYEQSAGVPYTGRRYESQVVLDVLGKIGFTAFREYVNLYEDDMNDGVGDSPFDQLSINVDVFTDNDLYCDEVLKEVLKKYGACIRQIAGVFNIYRPAELAGTTIYGRSFTAYNAKTAISFTPEQLIWRSGVTSSLRQMPGSTVTYQRPAKKVTIRQDYGDVKSWIQNYDFDINKYDAGDFDDWTIVSPSAQFTKISSINGWEGEKNGVGIGYAGVGTPVTTDYIYQTFGTLAASTSDIFEFSFDYRFRNMSTSPITTRIYIRLRDAASSVWLKRKTSSETELDESASGTYIITEDIVANPGLGEWNTWSRIKVGMTVPGPYVIFIFCTTDLNLTLGIKNIVFKATSDKVTGYTYAVTGKFLWWKFTGSTRQYQVKDIKEIVEKEYTATNAINGDELQYDTLLGDVVGSDIDNVLEQFAGALAVSVRNSLSVAAAAFVSAHASDYSPGGVTLTSSGNILRFTASPGGVDFTGATSITNTSGDISGSVSLVTANSPQVNAQQTIQLSGTSGTATISVENVDATATFATSLTITAANFVTNNAAAYSAAGITVTSDGDILTFEANGGEFDPAYSPSITTNTGDLNGDVDAEAQAYSAAVARVDEITLTGISGTANVTCDGVTEEISITETLEPTNAWNTRGGSENDPILQIVADEIAELRDRPKQFVSMEISERTKAATALNLIGNIQDNINTYLGYRRLFVVNRCSFSVKNRFWKLDLVEIGLSSVAAVTADSTTVTVDSTIITADSDV